MMNDLGWIKRLRDLDNSRLDIEADDSGFTANVRQSPSILFLISFFICVGVMSFWPFAGRVIILIREQHIDSLADVFLLVFYAFFAVYWICGCLANSFGREAIKGNRDALSITRGIFGITRTHAFPIQEIYNVRLGTNQSSSRFYGNNQLMGLAGDTVSFDFEHTTYTLGRRLSGYHASKLASIIEKFRGKY
jgi:hypothetical protein